VSYSAGSQLKLSWLSRPRTVLVVAKPSADVIDAFVTAVRWLWSRGMSVFVEPEAYDRVAQVRTAACTWTRPATDGQAGGQQTDRQTVSWTNGQTGRWGGGCTSERMDR
jgi:hypothetical protein